MAQMLAERASSNSVRPDMFIYGLVANAEPFKFEAARNLLRTPILMQAAEYARFQLSFHSFGNFAGRRPPPYRHSIGNFKIIGLKNEPSFINI
jgi:hypothetical protein